MCYHHVQCHRLWSNIPLFWSWMSQAWDSLWPGWKFDSPLSGIFPLTKPPDLLIILQILVMFSSDRLGSIGNLSLGHPLALWSLPDWSQAEEHLFYFFYDGWQQAFCSWGASQWWHSIICILLLLFVCSTPRLLILFCIMVITIWMLRDLLFISFAITPMWWANKVSAQWSVSASFLLPAMQKGCKRQYLQQH